jgi:hypothetical protein
MIAKLGRQALRERRRAQAPSPDDALRHRENHEAQNVPTTLDNGVEETSCLIIETETRGPHVTRRRYASLLFGG